MEQHHGWNFEVAPNTQSALANPVSLKAMGRVRHEAIAVKPRNGTINQTEDRGDGLFFRFLPGQPGQLAGQAPQTVRPPGLIQTASSSLER